MLRTGRIVKIAVVTVLLTVIALYVILPVVWLLLAATKDNQQLFALPALSIPSHIKLGSNVTHAFQVNGGLLLYWLVNSVGYAVVISLGSTYLAALAGYALAKLTFPGRGVFSAVIVGSLMVPGAVLVIPIFILEHFLRITNTYEGVILPSLLSAFAVFFMMVYVKESVPDALIEAARVDGADHWRIFHRIAIPLMKPGVVTLILISFIAAWNNYFLPLVLLSNQKLFPMTLGLSTWLSTVTASPSVTSSSVIYPDIVIGTVISVIPTLLAFPILQRYVARGLTLGAVVGE